MSILVVFCHSVNGQSKSSAVFTSLSGYVSDTTGAPIPEAKVSLVIEAVACSSKEIVTETRAGLEGQFSLGAKPGTYVLEIKSNGFAGFKLPVKVAGESQALGRMQLQAAPEYS